MSLGHARSRRAAGRELSARAASLSRRLLLRGPAGASDARHAADQAHGARRAASRWASSPPITCWRSGASSRRAISRRCSTRTCWATISKCGWPNPRCCAAASATSRSSPVSSSATTRATRRSRRQVTFNSDLIYDVLRRHQPDHVLLRATVADAATGLTDVRRLGEMLARVKGRITLPRTRSRLAAGDSHPARGRPRGGLWRGDGRAGRRGRGTAHRGSRATLNFWRRRHRSLIQRGMRFFLRKTKQPAGCCSTASSFSPSRAARCGGRWLRR